MYNPCFKCPNRTTGCHAACDSYKDWRDNDLKKLHNYNKKYKPSCSVMPYRYVSNLIKKPTDYGLRDAK